MEDVKIIAPLIAKELKLDGSKIEATLNLLDEGNTIPFVARYRKEVTGSLDEEQIRNISERAQYLRSLAQRREEILSSISSLGISKFSSPYNISSSTTAETIWLSIS